MRWLTPEQYADAMQLTVRAVNRMCRDGLLKCRKVGRFWRIHPSEIQ